MALGINGLDHFVLTVADGDRTVRFYNGILEMEIETFGGDRLAIRMGGQKINIHVAGREIEPHAARPRAGAGDFCLLTDRPVEQLIPEIESRGGAIELGPVPRTGSLGAITSIYLRDPDGNLIEIANQAG